MTKKSLLEKSPNRTLQPFIINRESIPHAMPLKRNYIILLKALLVIEYSFQISTKECREAKHRMEIPQ